MDKCQYGVDTREMLEKVESGIERSEDKLNGNLERLWAAIDKMNSLYINRLPGWASVAISVLAMLVGALITTLFKRM